MKDIKSAVILAAGMGTRLRGVTNNMIPKGFLKIEDKGLVERSIENLRSVGIKKIYIATGHLSEFYENLAKKNDFIEVKKNENFANTGSMASLAIFKSILNEDFLLLESDLIYEKRALIECMNYSGKDCVLVSGKTNSGDEVYIELKEGSLHNACKDKAKVESVYGELVGICKISKELFDTMVSQYENTSVAQYHYEDALVDSAKTMKIGCHKVEDLIWAEIDDESHLKRVKNDIIPKLRIKNEI
ncbi:Choline kinase [Clostridium collagenovorans DSM 3089]|uniref:Choline kinase n=1 Tax=Clostridium collagenovorans DSM 3089 TaxID=1121306 RepID=A0A1M5YJ44_9CLOT|nr:phosphocholine cytidylyltransferase family protein [Clostridium collagenovorans]SHI12050.1 Choline kinase [Clostridium collagenovorans DSM 3089]